MKIRNLFAASVSLAMASSLCAQNIVIDGIADDAYGDALLLQQVQTQFGNADLGEQGFCNGSEIDGLFAVVEGDTLYLLFAGNLESNYNKLEIFLDAVPGEGQNPLLGNNPDVDFGALNRMGRFEDQKTGEVQPGLTFDDGFIADFWIGVTGGPGVPDKKGATPYDTYMSYAELLTDGGDTGSSGFAGPGGSGELGALLADNFIQIAIDNSNVVGVTGGDQPEPDGGAGVITGVEIAIPLSVLGHVPGDDILVNAFVNGSGHDFVSNQVMGPLLSGSNLGEPRFVNFAGIDGDQFATIDTQGGGGDPCTGDFNGDGVVNGADFGLMLAVWGDCSGCPEDLNGDGVVNGADVGLILAVWGGCSGGGGDEGCGDCNQANDFDQPGCSDVDCESIVCTIDAVCCEVNWDDFCASLAESNCDCGP